MPKGLRYWIGMQGGRAKDIPLQDFTGHVAQLKTALALAVPIPSWVVNDHLALPTTSMEIVVFGTFKVQEKSVHDNHDKWSRCQNTDLNLYYKTLLCDFKAIHRHLKRQIPAKARRLLASLSGEVDAAVVGALLLTGGLNARIAWALVLWWREVRAHGFNSKPGLASKHYWLAVDPGIPTWAGNAASIRSFPPGPDFAHLWLVRWICAAGLLRFWHSVRNAVAYQSHLTPTDIDVRIFAASLDPRWGLGISADNALTLCFSNDVGEGKCVTETISSLPSAELRTVTLLPTQPATVKVSLHISGR